MAPVVPTTPAPSIEVWIKQFDPTHQRYYFHNAETGVTTWDEPTGPGVSVEEINEVWDG